MCPSESDIIRLVAGELPEDRRAALLAHVEQCPQCGPRYESIAATHLALGDWDVPAPTRDFAPAVLARVRRAAFARTAAAVAASIVLASSVGISVALMATPRTAPVAQSRPAPSAEQAALCLGLDSFGGESVGLGAVFAPEEQPQ
jgi:hypothetical protein